MDSAALIAIDWGTTSARAYRLGRDGRTLGETSAPLGIQQVKGGAYQAALATLLGDWRERVPRLACGMIGSRQGWAEAPYRRCPAALDSLASGLVGVPDGDLRIVPGVSCRDAAGVPDVMRGEETQILGALAGASGIDCARRLIVLPGTHSKWALVERATIETFATFMTGEVFAVLSAHSILGRTMADESGAAERSEGFRRGLAHALEKHRAEDSLLHELFGVRTLALCGELAPGASAEYLSGLLVGHEIGAGLAWCARHGAPNLPITVIGAPALGERYRAAFAAAGVAASEGPADAAARGLWLIAQRAGLVPC